MNSENQTITPESNNKSSKRTLYIIAIVIVLILLFALLKGSNNGNPGTGAENTNPMDMSAIDMTRNPDGSYSKTYSNGEGSITIGGGKLPADWPSDAPKYANASIQYSGSSNPQTGEAGSAVVFMTSDSVEKVVEFYKKSLVSNGWKIEQTANMGMSTVISATKDTRTFGVYISSAGEGKTSVTIGISKN